MDHRITLQIEDQDFYKIREECLSTNTNTKQLWEDPLFEAADSSLAFEQPPKRKIEWKRPKDIAPEGDPCFIVDGDTRFDVKQGELGDCWLLSAIANLTLHPSLLRRVVPDDQGFADNYAGVFHFRFWQYGRWVDVVVDDRLPTFDGKLIYLRSSQPNEFWSALLEKAYAKLHKSYEALKGGRPSEALVDFTGGISEIFLLKEPTPNLFNTLLEAQARNSLMCCMTESDPPETPAESRQPENRLTKNHAYSVTRVQYVDVTMSSILQPKDRLPLVRLRNPWGQEEWDGPWSDRYQGWKFVSEEDKKKMELVDELDGEFWMSFRDFVTHFKALEICHLTERQYSGRKTWTSSCEGELVQGENDEYTNRHLLTISNDDAEDEVDGKECTVIVELTQKNRRKLGKELLHITFVLYKDAGPISPCISFRKNRDVNGKYSLTPGEYCIVPTAKDKENKEEFSLRVVSDKKVHLRKLVQE